MRAEFTQRNRRPGLMQFRLGTFLIAVTLVAWIAGTYGPGWYRWLQSSNAPPPPTSFPRGASFVDTDGTSAYYLEPAETPLQ